MEAPAATEAAPSDADFFKSAGGGGTSPLCTVDSSFLALGSEVESGLDLRPNVDLLNVLRKLLEISRTMAPARVGERLLEWAMARDTVEENISRRRVP
jgi:hypothetical protein